MKKVVCLVCCVCALGLFSCSQTERDGRKYYGGVSPLQGKMGVSFKRVPGGSHASEASGGVAADGNAASASVEEEPPGLLDHVMPPPAPDEPGAKYWMHAQQSAEPLQSKMGVRVKRKKKE